MSKTCNYDCFCKYRLIGDILIECSFNGYCDFQAPRDSRIYPVDAVDKKMDLENCPYCHLPLTQCQGHTIS